MTTEELLIPRYKCIAPVLFNRDELYNVGDVFTDNGKSPVLNQHGWPVYPIEWAKYPHLFEPLPWWKDRKLDELPEFVKQTGYVDSQDNPVPDRVVRVRKHFASNSGDWRNDSYLIFAPDLKDVSSMSYAGWEPATKTDYDNYIRQKEGES